MEDNFANQAFQDRMECYFETLSKSTEIKSIRDLASFVEKQYPGDWSVNYNRLQRDIKKFTNDKHITNQSPIDALRKWAKKNYMKLPVRILFCDAVIDVRFDYPDTFIKTNPYRAEELGNIIRNEYKKECYFVMADYDTVLIHFISKKNYEEFKRVFESYLEVDLEEDEQTPESR